MVIGYIWYLPAVFGTVWMRMSNITPEMAEKGKKRMPFMAIVGLLGALLVAYVMSYVSAAWGFYTWQGALQLGFWCWAGFVAPTMLGTVLWEQKPFRLYLINVAYWLVAMLVMAQIIVFGYGMNFATYMLGRKFKEWKFDWEQAYVEGTDDVIFRNTFRDMRKILSELAAKKTSSSEPKARQKRSDLSGCHFHICWEAK